MIGLPGVVRRVYLSKLIQPMIGCSVNHVTSRSFSTSRVVHRVGGSPADALTQEYDAIIVGAGHNGLTASAYLQKAGLKTLVLERRHIIGGAAVTEEIVPGFKFSRCSYVLSLLRPDIYKDLELKVGFRRIRIRFRQDETQEVFCNNVKYLCSKLQKTFKFSCFQIAAISL